MTRLKHQIIDRFWMMQKFLKNPVDGMKNLPSLTWGELFIFITGLSALSGALQGLISRNILSIIAGILFFPIGVLLSLTIATAFFYYVFLFVFERQLDLKQLATHLVFAAIPMLILSVISSILPAVQVVGMLAAVFLLLVGFHENFGLPRKKMAKLLGVMFFVYLIYWIYGAISSHQVRNDLRYQTSPESLDILEKELGN